MKHVPLYIVRNPSTGALYTPVPVDCDTATHVYYFVMGLGRCLVALHPAGYGIPYVGVFRL